ncbi:MAG: hypothetical protein QOD42_2472 [Sphingomonadales bacterium]|jgi:hypothetical protein|nr:hypothetical protein [Sphingomonadales bacterium]
MIASADGRLYQLRASGQVLRYNGTPCAAGCNGWETLDLNAATMAIAGAGE